VNTDLLQILADIFARPVYTASAPNSGALGGALRAIDVINQKPNSVSSTFECVVAAKPRAEYTALYDGMLNRYTQLEETIVQGAKQ
jgi:sugar (pentulose or hexulose) kinase